MLVVCAVGLSLTSCKSVYTQNLGSVGGTTYSAVRAPGLFAPSMAAMVKTENGENKEVVTATGVGAGQTLITGGSQVAAGYLFGSKIRPDTTSVSLTGGNSLSGAYARGGSAVSLSNSSSRSNSESSSHVTNYSDRGGR